MSLKIIEITGTYESALPKPKEWKPMREIVTKESLEQSLTRMCDALEAKRKVDIERAVAAEREACAKRVEDYIAPGDDCRLTAALEYLAAEIRKGT